MFQNQNDVEGTQHRYLCQSSGLGVVLVVVVTSHRSFEIFMGELFQTFQTLISEQLSNSHSLCIEFGRQWNLQAPKTRTYGQFFQNSDFHLDEKSLMIAMNDMKGGLHS